MESECVYDCIHPWWGGNGICTASDAGDPVCVCDDDYASRDAKGNASCVPRRVLVAAYLTLATLSVAAAALIVWNINQYRHLPVRVQSAKKTSIRMRALVSTSVFVIGFGSVGSALFARGGKTTYADAGVLQIVYVVLLPSMVFGIAMMAEYWVECLPSQVFSPGSFAGALRNASETSNAFVLAGLANASPISALGILTLLFDDWPQRVADVVVGAVTIGTVGVIMFVAIQTTGVINQALAKGSASSKAFYTKARTNLWRQAATLCGVACGVVVVTLIKQLTTIGRDTPSVISTAQVLCAHAAAVVFASATRFGAPRSAGPRDRPCADGSCEDGTDVGSGPRGSTATAISDAAVAMHVLLLAQRRRFTAHAARSVALSDEKDAPAWSGVAGENAAAQENGEKPLGVVVKSVSDGRKKPNRSSLCGGAAARVLPTNEDLVSLYTADRDSTAPCVPPNEEEWTIDSVDEIEQQEVRWR